MNSEHPDTNRRTVMAFKRMKNEQDHEQGLKAKEAWQQIKKGWSHWTEDIGPWMLKARTVALRIAGTNEPTGHKYTSAMSEVLRAYELDDINETARADLLNIMEDLEAVQEWRTKYQKENFVELNNPSTVWRAYSKHLKDEVAAKIKEEKAAKAKAAEEFAVEYETEDDPEPSETDNPYVAARDEASDDEAGDYKALLAVASAELKEKEAEIDRLKTFRTDFDEFDAETPFSQQLRLRFLGLMALVTDDSRWQNLSAMKKQQRAALIKQMTEFERALSILLEAEAAPAGTRQS